MVIALIAALPKLMSCTFQLAIYKEGENQNQPISARPIHGMMTPHTVMEETRPVYLAPPKFRTVASQSVKMVAAQVIIGSRDLFRNPSA